ncbi:MAG: 7-carboxy-7-deazaguanine synthase QueE [Gammaproteobacteria bacterium]|nr:7-carboxy-7-deazaguanine synthase QueE [Gammaproteobacteria bacterium]MDE2023482.1 7-carboxy-7-deazaguanine synthase QueE [Gammaproteobacteria bacterium]
MRRDDLPVTERLRITEIFHSIQGEADSVGWPTVFVRLTGCPLRCQYCDTAYAFHGGEWRSFDAILKDVAQYRPEFVTVTGGEPLAQPNCLGLLTRLCDAGYRVSIETGGALSIAGIDARVVRVMDLKTPGSGESARNLYINLAVLHAQDQVKFVICDRADYEWSKRKLEEFRLSERCRVLFSPSHTQLEVRALAEWVLADRLPVRLQVQLHKYIWGNVPGR